jgi:hypothetical protein
MRLLSLLLASLTLTGSALAAQPSSDAAFYLEAAECTAGFKDSVVQHLKQPPRPSATRPS